MKVAGSTSLRLRQSWSLASPPTTRTHINRRYSLEHVLIQSQTSFDTTTQKSMVLESRCQLILSGLHALDITLTNA